MAAHDCSDGGLAVAIAEMLVTNGLGANVELRVGMSERGDALLFGEVPGRVIIACESSKTKQLLDRVSAPLRGEHIGNCSNSLSTLQIGSGNQLINCEVQKLKRVYENSIPDLMDS